MKTYLFNKEARLESLYKELEEIRQSMIEIKESQSFVAGELEEATRDYSWKCLEIEKLKDS